MEYQAPDRDGADAQLGPYWEKQEDLHCGRHALNMILGRNVFSSYDIDRKAQEVDLSCGARAASLAGFAGQTSADYVSCAKGGNWDADVLLKALNSQPGVATAEYAEQQMPSRAVYATTYLGTLIHRTADASGGSRLESRGGHYTCFRKEGTQLYHLDSLNKATANHAISLRAAQRLVQQPGANCWHVFTNAPPLRQGSRPPLATKVGAGLPADEDSTGSTILPCVSVGTTQTAPPGLDVRPQTPAPKNNRRRGQRSKRARGKLTLPKHSPTDGSNGDSSDPGRSSAKKKPKMDGTASGRKKKERAVRRALTASNLTELLRQLPQEVVAQAMSDLGLGPHLRRPSAADPAGPPSDAPGRAPKRPRRRTRMTCDFESIPENPEEEAAAEEEAKKSTESADPGAVTDDRTEESDSIRTRMPAGVGAPEAVSSGSDKGGPTKPAPLPGFASRFAAALSRPGAAAAPRAMGVAKASRAGKPGGKEGKTTETGKREDATDDRALDGGDREVADDVADIEDVSKSGRRSGPETRYNRPASEDQIKASEPSSPKDSTGREASMGTAPRADRDAADANVPRRRSRAPPPAPPDTSTRSPRRKKCDGGAYAEPCVFSRNRPGAPARRRRDSPTCFWCSAELATTDSLSTRSKRRYVRAYQTFPADVQARALTRMRPNLSNVFRWPTATREVAPGQERGKRKDELKSDLSSHDNARRDDVEESVADSDAEPGLHSRVPQPSAATPSGRSALPKKRAASFARLSKGASSARKKSSRKGIRARAKYGSTPAPADLWTSPLSPGRGLPPGPGYCPGPSPGVRCFYSLTEPGVAAQLSSGRPTCWWCSLADMRPDDSESPAMIDETNSAPRRQEGDALDFAVAHVFYNFPPRVQWQARKDSGRTVRDILDRTRGLCRGAQFGNPCEFSTGRPGHPVRAVRNLKCMCCKADFAPRLQSNQNFFARVRRRVYLALQPEYQAKLLKRVPKNLRAAMASAPSTPRDSWARVLGNRQTWTVYSDADRTSYRAHVLNDQRRARNAFSLPKRHLRRGAVVANKTTLPVAKLPIARAFERWCEYDSWAVCGRCERMQPRDITQLMLLSLCDAPRAAPLRESQPSPRASPSLSCSSSSNTSSSLHATACHSSRPSSSAHGSPPAPGCTKKEPRFAAPAIDPKHCSNCSARRPHEVPGPGAVPEPLRNLALPILAALSPLGIITGPLVRANVRPSSLPGRKRHDHLATGYRQHTSMIRFAWHEDSVDSRVAALKSGRLRAAGAAALAFLKESRDSDYHEFYREHRTFLRRQTGPAAGTPGPDARLLSLAFIERPGIECALWPHLFWRRDLCFSHERVSDPRRGRQRQRVQNEHNRGDGGADLLLPTPPSTVNTPTPQGSTIAGSSNNGNSASSSNSNKTTEKPSAPRQQKTHAARVGRDRRKQPKDGPQRKRERARKKRAAAAPALRRSSKGPGEGRGAGDADAEVRHSAKGSFAAKALGPLLDYGSSFEILQYVYDLTMWSSIGSKRTVGDERVPLRLMMKGYPFNPLYWRSLHLALVDMVRQLGPPVIFWTFSPYEWSFPYHVWIRDAMTKLLRGRLFLPIAETLHLAHVMSQLVRGLLTGRSHGDRREGGRWTRHLLAARDPRTRRVLDLPFFSRLEFQDGTRKAATQDYHGSGRPHVHVLVFCKLPQELPIDDAASATLSDTRFPSALSQYVLGSQRDQTRASGRDVSLGPTHYDRASASWRLFHTPKDKAAGLRAYFPVIMDSLKCHQDLQLGAGKGLLAAYVAKYVSKFSSSALDEWLSDYLEANAVAANFLYRFKPFEPEMILQIFGQRFRQWDVSTDSRGKRDFRVPLPGAATYPSEIAQYVRSDWRSENTSLLDFLRKTNNKGEIAGWLRQKYRKEVPCSPARAEKTSNRRRQAKQREDRAGKSASTRGRGDGAGSGPRRARGRQAGVVASRCRKQDRPDGRETGEEKGAGAGYREGNGQSNGASNGSGLSPVDSSASRPSNGGRGQRAPPKSLATFAAGYEMQGEQIVAADMHSRASDTFYGQWMMIHVPFRNPDDLINRDIMRCVPKHLQFLANVLFGNNPVAGKFWRNEYRIRGEMECEGYGAGQIDSIISMIRANRELIADYLGGQIADADEAKTKNGNGNTNDRPDHQGLPDRGNEGGGGIIRAPLPDMADLNSQQRHFVLLLNAHMELNANITNIRTAEARESHIAHLRSSKVVICMGPPGTGKTTAARLSIQVALDLGGRVLLALPTAQLASNLRTYYVGEPNVVIDTCAAAFGLMEDPCESLPHISLFSLIMVDEFSQLSRIQFERIVKLWASVDKLPALVFCGDPYQMSGFGDERPWHSRLWRQACYRVHLVQAYRCKDAQFWAKLSALRIAKPSELEVRNLCVKRKAWEGYPTVRKIRRYLKRFPQTTILTCTRRGTHVLNNLVLRVMFPKQKPVTYLPGDVDTNPQNYLRDGSMKPAPQRRSLWVPIFISMKICITQNVRKEADFVNGMLATVEWFYPASSGLRVRTATGRCLVIYKWKNPREPEIPAHYPIRPGYASTIMKYQGAELTHVTVYLDAKNVPGAAYTALSRVQSGRQYRLAGTGRLEPDHFTPADVSGLR